MAFGVVIGTTTGSGVAGPLPFTRIRGRLLAGQSAEPPTNSIQTGTVPGGTQGYNGTAAAPLYSFYNRPDMGVYAATVTTSAGGIADARWSVDGTDVLSVSTENIKGANGSAATPMYGFLNSTGVGLFLQSSAAAPIVRMATLSVGITDWSTAGFGVGIGTSSAGTLSTGGVFTTSGGGMLIYIPQTTAVITASSDGGPAPAALNALCPLIFDHSRKKLCVYSTISGSWYSLAAATCT